jgi:sigma-B regulation protein RsbU (phosphoserine phosphatase)
MSTTLISDRGNTRDEWLYSTCRTFSDTTGWQLEFTPIEDLGLGDLSEHSLNWCWHTELTNGICPIGVIHLQPPDGFDPLVTFESAYRLADLIAANINRFLQQRAEVFEQATEIGALIGSKGQSNVYDRLRVLLRSAVCLSRFRASALFVLEPDGTALRLRLTNQLEQQDVPFPRRCLDLLPPDLEVLNSGLVLLQRNDGCDERWLPETMNAAVCVPIQSESGPIGTLWLYDRRFKDSDTLADELIAGFAHQIADVFERIVLLQDSETCDRLTRELDIIASTTDDIREVNATYPGCDVAVRCLSRCEVGGDLCEIVPFDEHRTVFVIGDASGDSVPAAMVMTATRGAFHALLEVCRLDDQAPVPEEFVGELNRAILQVTAAQQFITLIFGVFDSRTRTLSYTNAGHCPPLHIQGDRITALDSQGLLLGVLGEAEYTMAELTIEPDDILVLFSDGIVEARNTKEKMFRNEGILDSVNGRRFESAFEVLQTIWSRYEDHTGGRNLDDRTLMVIRGVTADTAEFAESTFSGSRQVY